MSVGRRILATCPVALLYFAAASLSMAFDERSGNIPFLWAATAIVIADLHRRPRDRWVERLPGFVLASFGATIIFGRGWGAAVPTAAADLLEAIIAARLLAFGATRRAPIGSLAWLIWFLIPVGLVAPIVVGCCLAMIALSTGFPPLSVIPGIVAGHAFGNICFTPLAILLQHRGGLAVTARRIRAGARPEAILLFGLVAGISFGVFWQNGLPLLFLPLFPVILVSFRLGHGASGVAIMILGTIATALTLAGLGPIHLVQGSTGQQLLFLQFYLAATILSVLPVGADLAVRKRLHRQLRANEERYRLLAEHSTDIIMHLEIDGTIRYIAPSIRQISGYEPEDLAGGAVARLVAPEHLERVIVNHMKVLGARGATHAFEYLAVTASGDRRWFEAHARAIMNPDGKIESVLTIVRDINARKEKELQLSEAALVDSLTGLSNRLAYREEVERRLQAGETGACVAMLDIDHFKQVNDRYGHDAGDIVLRGFAEVARRIVRDGDVVARMGGEEFAFYFPSIALPQALAICDRLRNELGSTIFRAGNSAINVTVSGGVASLGEDGIDAALKIADMALYRAKQAGRNQLALAA